MDILIKFTQIWYLIRKRLEYVFSRNLKLV